MRVLICGSRDWTKPGPVVALLDGLYAEHADGWNTLHRSPFVVIHGGARGADALAKWWVECSPHHPGAMPEYDMPPVVQEAWPAKWKAHGKGAGPIRNEEMLRRGEPNVVFAFVCKPLAESRGTADMLQRAKKAGLPVYVTERV